jgi:hypothetical protein
VVRCRIEADNQSGLAMPELLGAPSFVTIRTPPYVDWQTLESLFENISPANGPVLAPLGYNRFVLARPVHRRTLRGQVIDALLKEIRADSWVADVRLEPFAAVLQDLRSRPIFLPAPSTAHRPARDWSIDAAKAFSGIDSLRVPSRRIRLAHLSTGYTPHSELTIDISDVGLNFLEPDQPAVEVGWHPGSPGHGTATLDIIARLCCLSDHYLTVVPYRVTNSEFVDSADSEFALDRAIRHAAFDAGCDIICVPISDPCTPPTPLGRAD